MSAQRFTPRVGLSRWTGGGGSGWTLRVEDEASGAHVFDVDLTPEEFSAMFSGSVVTGADATVAVPRYLNRKPTAIRAEIPVKLWDVPVEHRISAVYAILATTESPGMDWDELSPISESELLADHPNGHRKVGADKYEIHVLKYGPAVTP